MSTEHNAITGSNLHENKGVSTASDDNVLTATSGASVWKKLTASNLTGTGNSFGGQLLHVRDEKASGTSGGTFTSGAWRTRTLNTTKTNEITGASVATNQITLPAGTYDVWARANALQVNNHIAKLYNITDASDILIGSNAYSNNGAPYGANDSIVTGRFTIAGSKVVELQHRCVTSEATNGFGAAASLGVVEVYAEIKIWKIA